MATPQISSRSRTRLFVIYNPAAGRRRARRLDRTVALLRAAGREVTLLPTAGPGDATRLARQVVADRRADVVIAAGGDGTVNEVVNGLAGSGLPLAIIPLGTANVLATEIGLGATPEQAAATVLAGAERPVCLGRANGRLFTVMAGVGFDARVVAGVDLRLKRLLGKGAYVLESLRQFLAGGGGVYNVSVDGEEYQAASVIVSNGRYYAGRFVIAPRADITTASFEVCLFTGRGRMNLLRYLLATVANRVPLLADCRVVSGRRVDIQGIEGEPVQADGDCVCRLPVVIEVVKDGIDLIYPSPGS